MPSCAARLSHSAHAKGWVNKIDWKEKKMKTQLNATSFSLIVITGLASLLFASCGKVNDAITEINNDEKIKGHWLLTGTENAGAITNAIERETVVLSFKNGQAAFSPTDSITGRLYVSFSPCTRGPRPYRTDKNEIVFGAVAAVPNCTEKRITVQQLDAQTLKFPDPDNMTLIRVFTKIDEARYFSLVKPSDRRL